MEKITSINKQQREIISQELGFRVDEENHFLEQVLDNSTSQTLINVLEGFLCSFPLAFNVNFSLDGVGRVGLVTSILLPNLSVNPYITVLLSATNEGDFQPASSFPCTIIFSKNDFDPALVDNNLQTFAKAVKQSFLHTETLEEDVLVYKKFLVPVLGATGSNEPEAILFLFKNDIVVNASVFTCISLCVVTIYRSKGYILHFQSEEAAFPNYLPTIDSILSSFRFFCGPIDKSSLPKTDIQLTRLTRDILDLYKKLSI